MAIMKILNKTAIVFMLAVFLIACSKDSQPIADGMKTVRITISSRVGESGSGTVSPEDAIHSLRIYAFDADNNLVGYHYENSLPNTPGSYSFSMPLNFSYKEDFPTTGTVTAKFYVVANERGATIGNGFSFPEAEIDAETGLWKWKSEGSTITPDALSALLITGYGTKTESEIASTGLPMSFKDDVVELTTETNQTLTFAMKRAVVKLHTKFQNDGLETTVDKISFGAFQADKGYLFEQGDGKIVPDDVSYTTPSEFAVNITIGQNSDASVVYYQLPSSAGNGKYTFGFSLANGTSFGPSELKPDNGTIASIDRNHGLVINVIVEDNYIKFGVPAVEPWKTSTGGIITVE